MAMLPDRRGDMRLICPPIGFGLIQLEGVSVCRKAARDRACQDIASAAYSQASIATGVDDRGKIRGCSDAARTFQNNDAPQLLGDRLGTPQSVPLHLRAAQPQQLRGFERVRCEDLNPPPLTSGAKALLQRRVLGDVIERVCIEHHGPGVSQGQGKHLGHGFATTTPNNPN